MADDTNAAAEELVEGALKPAAHRVAEDAQAVADNSRCGSLVYFCVKSELICPSDCAAPFAVQNLNVYNLPSRSKSNSCSRGNELSSDASSEQTSKRRPFGSAREGLNCVANLLTSVCPSCRDVIVGSAEEVASRLQPTANEFNNKTLKPLAKEVAENIEPDTKRFTREQLQPAATKLAETIPDAMDRFVEEGLKPAADYVADNAEVGF